MKHQITLKDLARALGVSTSTVSRALSDHPNISPATKLRVRRLAQRLNYKPNEIALSLKNQCTKTIGVIVPEIVHFFFSTVISGIEEIAYSNGYTVILCQSNESYKKEVIDTAALISHRVDGLLVSHARDTSDFSHFEDLMTNKIPIVFFDRVPHHIEAPKVIIEDFIAAKLATEHLIKQGCKRIAHLAGPPDLNISIERKKGYKTALEESQLFADPQLIEHCVHGTQEMGYHKMKHLLQLDNIPDGLFANNDVVAFGAMRAIQDAGLRIPEDIAVIGFSNWQFSSLVQPALSSVAQPGLIMGRMAAQLLMDQLTNPKRDITPKIHSLPVEIIARKSSLKKRPDSDYLKEENKDKISI